jgi:hypothetical protein
MLAAETTFNLFAKMKYLILESKCKIIYSITWALEHLLASSYSGFNSAGLLEPHPSCISVQCYTLIRTNTNPSALTNSHTMMKKL